MVTMGECYLRGLFAMSPKAYKPSQLKSEDHQAAAPSSLLTLPDAVVAQIAQCSKQQSGHPFLRLSRGCRDAVLHSCSTIRLTVSSDSTVLAATARLLHRACTSAAPGVCLRLDLTTQSHALPQLLQPGIEAGGWANVHKLEVVHARTSLYLIPSAFPSVKDIRLNNSTLGDGALFTMLSIQPSCSVSSLRLGFSRMEPNVVDVAAAALARLPSLELLQLDSYVSARLASRLTGLTSLGAVLGDDTVSSAKELRRILDRNARLECLAVDTSNRTVPGECLRLLLTSHAKLRELDLTNLTLNDQGMDVLLQHGTNIQQLALGSADLTRSWASSTAGWQRLKLMSVGIVTQLAHLPLSSVQVLETRHAAGTLPLGLTASGPAVERLRQAISNLLTCPAWQQQPASRVLLFNHGAVAVPSSQRTQLLSALAPLSGPHIQHLSLSLNMGVGRVEVEALAQSLGGHLTSLYLHRGNIQPSFWPALSEHFPHLKRLAVGSGVYVAAHGIVAYLRTVAQPFTLCMAGSSDELEDCVAAWQLHGVTVSLPSPAEEFEFKGVLDSGSILVHPSDEDEDEEEEEEEEDEEIDYSDEIYY